MTHQTMNWEQVLWDAGHRVTRQRAAILDAVCAGGGHVALSDVYGRVRRADRSIDRSTVYRSLRLFTELGLVVAADTGGDEMLYEIAKPHQHHHLVCRSCRSEIEVGAAELEGLRADVLERHGFALDTDHLVIFGRCRRCRTEAAASRDGASL